MKTCYISLFCTEQIPIAYFCLHLYGLFLVGPRSNLELVEDTPIVFAPTNESRRPHRVPCGQALVNYGDYSVDKIQIAHFHLHLCLCCFWLVKTRLIGYETNTDQSLMKHQANTRAQWHPCCLEAVTPKTLLRIDLTKAIRTASSQ